MVSSCALMRPIEPIDPNAQLGYQVARVADQLSKRWFSALKGHGINARQFHVLAVLAKELHLSQAELARRVLVTPQSMSESLAAMVTSGVITRQESATGKSAAVKLTRAGEALLRRAYPVVAGLERDAFAALTATERRQLGRLLDKLLAE
jgi:DNA-binding MarR family transcriptional regulator